MADPTLPPALPPAPALAVPVTPLPWWVVPVIALVVLIIYATVVLIFSMWGNDTQKTTALQSVLILGASISAFYFGSSAGSDKKDNTIAANTAALATSSPAIVSTADEAALKDAAAVIAAHPVPAP